LLLLCPSTLANNSHRLQDLEVQDNALSSLPPRMGLMAPQLRVLRLQGNGLRAIRRPVLDRGTAAVLEWLRDRIPVV
jgi:Leucine-rich repeat (LRR) protein